MQTKLTMAEFMLANPPTKKSVRIEAHFDDIVFLHSEGYSYQMISDAMLAMHEILITPEYLRRLSNRISSADKSELKSEKRRAKLEYWSNIVGRENELRKLIINGADKGSMVKKTLTHLPSNEIASNKTQYQSTSVGNAGIKSNATLDNSADVNLDRVNENERSWNAICLALETGDYSKLDGQELNRAEKEKMRIELLNLKTEKKEAKRLKELGEVN